MRKPAFYMFAKTKTQISFAVTAKPISAFVFARRIGQSLYFLYTKFQASSHLVWLYSLVCVGHGRKPQRPVFSQQCSLEKNGLGYSKLCILVFSQQSSLEKKWLGLQQAMHSGYYI